MKIALITFHRALNYGAVLQAYAIQKSVINLLNENKSKCYMLDYKCDAIESMRRLIHKNNIVKDLFKYPFRAKNVRVKEAHFDKFISKYLNIYKLSNNNLASIESEFDVFITGSDQLWNYNICGNDSTYFLDFVNDNKKKYSYAVSFGRKKNFEEYEDKIIDNIKSFSTISMREPICSERFRNVGCNIRVDIDPTLLLDSNQWQEQFQLKNDYGQYILVYCVAKPKNLLNIAKELSKRTGLKVIFLTEKIMDRWKYPDFKCVFGEGPEEFVALIKNATYVLTTSFHGTVFSIIFHKKFYSEVDNYDGKNERIYKLLDLTNTLKCASSEFVMNDCELSGEEWKNVDEEINKLKNNSIEYIKTIIGENNL